MSTDDLPFRAASERNRGPILEVLTRVLPSPASVLEIASGTGQHAEHFAAAGRGWRWQPTDADPQCLWAIARRCAAIAQVAPPLALDVLQSPWPAGLGRFDAAVCINLLHVAAWPACAALMQGAAGHLREGGVLVIYGPFLVEGEPTAPGNLAFDDDLRRRNPAWGLRELGAVAGEAERAGFAFVERVAMPVNNLSLVFRLARAVQSQVVGIDVGAGRDGPVAD